jgi:hypothetical protein
MTLTMLVAIVLIVLIIGGLPAWGLSTGYGPSGILGVVLLVVLLWMVLGGHSVALR